MGHPHPGFGGRLQHSGQGIIDGADPVAHVVDLAASLQLPADGIAHHVRVPFAHEDLHRPALVRRREDQRHVPHPRKAHL